MKTLEQKLQTAEKELKNLRFKIRKGTATESQKEGYKAKVDAYNALVDEWRNTDKAKEIKEKNKKIRAHNKQARENLKQAFKESAETGEAVKISNNVSVKAVK